jgi:DNA-binding NarL/FixJ family response regulator
MVDIAIMASGPARRAWLERMLRRETSFHIAATAGTFPLLRSMLSESVADVVVVDLILDQPETNAEWLIELFDLASLIVLGSDVDQSIFNSILHAESGGLLRSDASAEQIVRAIHAVYAGLLVLDGSVVPRSETEHDLREQLTPREIDVLRLLAEGLANREIANRLDISEHTIKFHIRSVMGKLGASTRTEAVTRGFRTGLIEL